MEPALFFRQDRTGFMSISNTSRIWIWNGTILWRFHFTTIFFQNFIYIITVINTALQGLSKWVLTIVLAIYFQTFSKRVCFSSRVVTQKMKRYVRIWVWRLLNLSAHYMLPFIGCEIIFSAYYNRVFIPNTFYYHPHVCLWLHLYLNAHLITKFCRMHCNVNDTIQ